MRGPYRVTGIGPWQVPGRRPPFLTRAAERQQSAAGWSKREEAASWKMQLPSGWVYTYTELVARAHKAAR